MEQFFNGVSQFHHRFDAVFAKLLWPLAVELWQFSSVGVIIVVPILTSGTQFLSYRTYWLPVGQCADST